MNPGINEILLENGHVAVIELKTVPTLLSGICHTLQYKSMQGVGESWGSVYIGYKKTLEDSDIPRKFRIFFTPKDEWYGVVIGNSIF